MSHEPNNKGFRFASLASVHCHSTAKKLYSRVVKVETMMILNYLLKVSFFLRRKSEDRHFDFFTMKRGVGLRQPRLDCTVVMSHELNNKGFRYCEKIIFTGS